MHRHADPIKFMKHQSPLKLTGTARELDGNCGGLQFFHQGLNRMQEA